MIRWGFRDPGTSEVQVRETGKNEAEFDVAFDDAWFGWVLRLKGRGCPQVAGSSQMKRDGDRCRRKRGKQWGRRCIRRDGRGRGTSCAVERLNYRLWYASPNELGYASTNLRAYSTARTGRVATIGYFRDQAEPLSLQRP